MRRGPALVRAFPELSRGQPVTPGALSEPEGPPGRGQLVAPALARPPPLGGGATADPRGQLSTGTQSGRGQLVTPGAVSSEPTGSPGRGQCVAPVLAPPTVAPHAPLLRHALPPQCMRLCSGTRLCPARRVVIQHAPLLRHTPMPWRCGACLCGARCALWQCSVRPLAALSAPSSGARAHPDIILTARVDLRPWHGCIQAPRAPRGLAPAPWAPSRAWLR